MMKNQQPQLPYRFLPAFITADELTHMRQQRQTFSQYLRKFLLKTSVHQKMASRDQNMQCINDTGIRLCGPNFEHVEKIYIHTYRQKSQHTCTTEGSVILVIKDPHTLHYRYFKGIWDFTTFQINLWFELMPEIAHRDIT